MITPVVYRKWAREYLTRAERAPRPRQKRHFLRLAVSSTVCAQRLEAWNDAPMIKNGGGRKGQP
jgi:hypothetical protein